MPRKKKAASAKKVITGPRVAQRLPQDPEELYTHGSASWGAVKADTAHFASPNPPAAQMDGDLAALWSALQEAETGGPAATAALNAAAVKVHDDFEVLGKYVQSVLRTLPVEIALALLAEVLMYASNVGKRPPKQALAVKAGAVEGAVKLSALKVPGTILYTWQWSLDQVSWTTASQTPQTRTSISGLTAGKVYYFRFLTIKRDGTTGNPSQVVSFIVH